MAIELQLQHTAVLCKKEENKQKKKRIKINKK